MTFAVNWAEKLLSVRSMFADNVLINDPENYSKYTGALNYLMSPLNPRTIQTEMQASANASQYRPVQIRYNPHWGDDELVTTDSSATCDSNDVKRDKIETVEPTLYAEYKFTIDEDYVRQNSENGDSLERRLQRGFMKSMRVLRESMNNQIVAKLATKIGSNPAAAVSAGAYKTVEILNADGSVSVDTFDEVKNDQEDNFMTGTPAIIGMGNARKVFNRLAVGNLNTSAGIDFQQVSDQFGALLFKDHFTEANLGAADRALVMYPGLSQFFNYNLFKGDFAIQTSDFRIKGTMPDPIFPFEYDYIMKYDDQCSTGNGIQGAWVVRILCYFDVWTTPSDVYGEAYSDLNDFTGVLGYNFTQA